MGRQGRVGRIERGRVGCWKECASTSPSTEGVIYPVEVVERSSVVSVGAQPVKRPYSATCDEIPAILCNLPCTASENATCVSHVASGGATLEVASVEQPDGTCGCPSGYRLDLISDGLQLLCHRRKNCACTGPDGHVHEVSLTPPTAPRHDTRAAEGIRLTETRVQPRKDPGESGV